MSASTTTPVIDVHAHAVLEATRGAAGSAGPELGIDADGRPWYRVGDYMLRGVRYANSAFMDVGLRIEAMDKAGIDVQLLSPNPLTYFGQLDPVTATAFARTHNDALAETVSLYPHRLLGAAQLPMQDVDAAIDELHRAVRELGMAAAYIDTDPGRTLDDPALDPFYAALVELDVPLFVHPSPLGAQGPPDDERLRRFDLDLLLGFAYDETLAVAALVFGGVLVRHPQLDVCVSHGGGAAAFLAGRFERAVARRPWASHELAELGFASLYRKLWFDTHVHGDDALGLLTTAAGPERLVFGTNFAGWDAGEPELPDGLPEVVSRNAQRLLRIDHDRRG